MLKKILIIVVIVVAALLIYAASKPDTFSVVRSINIHASDEQVFAQINNFNRWKAWSPWEKMDPAMERIYSGPAEGVGSHYAWKGNDKVGQGSMEITQSMAPQKIIIKLDFIKPFETHNTTEFTITHEQDGVKVNWEMRGPNVFIGKLMSIFVDMDKMIGKDFETGLNNLKQLVESK